METQPEALPEQIASGEQARKPNRLLLGLGGLALAGAAFGGFAGTYAALRAPTETHIGGNDATVRLEIGHRNHLDLGPLGGLDMPSHLAVAGIPVGTDIVMKGFSKDAMPNQIISPDVTKAYLQLFNDPENAAITIQDDIVSHIKQDTLQGAIAGGLLAIAGYGGYALIGERRRRAAKELFRMRPSTATIAGVTACGLALGASVAGIQRQETSPIKADSIFTNTPLEGAQTTGALKTIADKGGQYVLATIKQTDEFFNTAEENLQAAFMTSEIEPPKPGIVRLLVVSDRHCNTGMDRIVEKAAKDYGTKIVISAGDDDISGTYPFEPSCTAGLAKRLIKDGNRLVSVLGNHDSSDITGTSEKQQGFTVLEGKTVVIDGIRLLGSRDPRRSIFMNGTATSDGQPEQESLAAQATALEESACTNQPIDIGVVHDPDVGRTLAESGCVRLVLDGHWHTLKEPQPLTTYTGDTSWQFIVGSTGGVGTNQISLGRPTIDATMSIVDYDPVLGLPLAYSNVIIHPDGEAIVQPFSAMPELNPVLVAAKQNHTPQPEVQTPTRPAEENNPHGSIASTN